MNRKLSKIIDKLLKNSENSLSLLAIEKFFNRGIPFNTPHDFKFLEISDKRTRLKLPFKKLNKNHLGGMHACAIATLGEYPAGLTLIKRFGSTKYRLIMSKLTGDYILQGREDLIGQVEVGPSEFDEIEEKLKSEDIANITISTNILNTKEEIVAVIQTTWQLKNWNSVKFKN